MLLSLIIQHGNSVTDEMTELLNKEQLYYNTVHVHQNNLSDEQQCHLFDDINRYADGIILVDISLPYFKKKAIKNKGEYFRVFELTKKTKKLKKNCIHHNDSWSLQEL